MEESGFSHISPMTKHNLSNMAGSEQSSFNIENFLTKITDTSTPGRPAFSVKNINARPSNLFIETSFDRRDENVKEIGEIWDECEKAIDELQQEKEQEVIELTEKLITRKLE